MPLLPLQPLVSYPSHPVCHSSHLFVSAVNSPSAVTACKLALSSRNKEKHQFNNTLQRILVVFPSRVWTRKGKKASVERNKPQSHLGCNHLTCSGFYCRPWSCRNWRILFFFCFWTDVFKPPCHQFCSSCAPPAPFSFAVSKENASIQIYHFLKKYKLSFKQDNLNRNL